MDLAMALSEKRHELLLGVFGRLKRLGYRNPQGDDGWFSLPFLVS
jgi:hypothetical protein